MSAIFYLRSIVPVELFREEPTETFTTQMLTEPITKNKTRMIIRVFLASKKQLLEEYQLHTHHSALEILINGESVINTTRRDFIVFSIINHTNNHPIISKDLYLVCDVFEGEEKETIIICTDKECFYVEAFDLSECLEDRIPILNTSIVESAMDVLSHLEEFTIREFAEQMNQPSNSNLIHNLLHFLFAHDMLVRKQNGTYRFIPKDIYI